MPYIITTRRSAARLQPGQSTCDLRAVATLDEARSYCRSELRRSERGHLSIGRLGLSVAQLPESGGSIGPLPDGTKIDVEATGYATLARAAGFAGLGQHEDADVRPTAAEILDAYNAAQ